MLTKCRFCDYKREKQLSTPILQVLAEKDLPMEDYLLWLERLLKTHGVSNYQSVKVHMGMKHKDKTFKYIAPDIEFNEAEKAAINGVN